MRPAICDNLVGACRALAGRHRQDGRMRIEPCTLRPEGASNIKGGNSVANLLDLAMLVCASVGAMVLGILTAYAILRAGFALMRPQRQPAAVKAQPETARVS